jgi:hypothetical protein
MEKGILGNKSFHNSKELAKNPDIGGTRSFSLFFLILVYHTKRNKLNVKLQSL